MYPVVALLELHLSQGTPKVVARHLFHVVELEELIPPVPIHVDEHVAVLVRREHLIGRGSGGKGGGAYLTRDLADSITSEMRRTRNRQHQHHQQAP